MNGRQKSALLLVMIGQDMYSCLLITTNIEPLHGGVNLSTRVGTLKQLSVLVWKERPVLEEGAGEGPYCSLI